MLQLKQMKELEQEKEVLLQGLEMMACGRDWYQQQLQRVQERQRHLGQSRASAVSEPPSSDPYPAPSLAVGLAEPRALKPGFWDSNVMRDRCSSPSSCLAACGL